MLDYLYKFKKLKKAYDIDLYIR